MYMSIMCLYLFQKYMPEYVNYNQVENKNVLRLD